MESTDAPYSYEISLNIAHAVIVANLRIAEATRISNDELAHDLATEMWRNFPDFDRAKGSYATWGGGVARRRLIDRLRRVSKHYYRNLSEAAGEDGEAVIRKVGEVPIEDHPDLPARGRWFAFFSSARPEIEKIIPRKLSMYMRGRLGHPPGAYAAAIAYREERGISWMDLLGEMGRSPDLLREFGFASVPARSNLLGSRRRLWAWAKRRA
jgi:DNA-directed RNA polymerase specialized sigma24 family protein